MRIARFNTGTILSSWSNLAMAGTLRSMGHDVVEGLIPTDGNGAVINRVSQDQFRSVRATMPTLEQRESCDAILVSGPEYIALWLDALYGKDAWRKLRATKVAFFLESSQREDVHFDYGPFLDAYDVHFYPDPRDAERLGGRHILTAVDTRMFKPCVHEEEPDHACDEACYARRMGEKQYPAAFVGTLYPKRMQFLERLLPLIPEVGFRAGGIAVRDLRGECHREWAELLVRNLREMKVHVGLPSNNAQMMVARPFETMAAGTFLLTYKTEDTLFRDGEHCCTYQPDKPEELAEMIRYYLAHDSERETIARAGCEEVRQKYSLEKRLGEVLAIVRAH